MRVLLAALIGVVLSSGAVEAQQPQPTGLDRANVQFAELWSRDGLPLVTDKIQQQLQTFVGTTHGSSNRRPDHFDSPWVPANGRSRGQPAAPGAGHLADWGDDGG